MIINNRTLHCFCAFLQSNADPKQIIEDLNKYKWGDGYLSVEVKRDREEEQNITALDIDPLSLYVGNLSQEITIDSLLAIYPKSKRIDIGYAKKMKYTRYAFVGFKTAQDALEAFTSTHNTQLHNKSLIVRFRRVNGTIGLPGESKVQGPNLRTTAAAMVQNIEKESVSEVVVSTSQTELVVSTSSKDNQDVNESDAQGLEKITIKKEKMDDYCDYMPPDTSQCSLEPEAGNKAGLKGESSSEVDVKDLKTEAPLVKEEPESDGSTGELNN